MDSPGDYIYLIAILIVAVSSILGKKKKKESEVQTTMPELPDLDDVIPEYTEYSESERPVYQPISKHNSTIEIPSYETVEDFSTLRAKEHLVHAAKKFIGSELTVSEENNFNILELDTVEDVKKAFIYSEIFQRKY